MLKKIPETICISALGVLLCSLGSAIAAAPSDEAFLTFSAEARLRYDAYDNRQLRRGQDYQQGLFRGILGADLRLNPNIQIHSEVGTGQVEGRRSVAPPNFQNDASLQQLFVDAHGSLGTTLVGMMLGRQEFADGPKQLISVSDGANLHRTWNGLRIYAQDQRYRLGGFDLRETRLEPGSFDEGIEDEERIQGLNAHYTLSPGDGSTINLDPFWIRSRNPGFRAGGQVGLDDRNTLGLRAWGNQGDLKFDWTLAHQRGEFRDRPVDAWGLFAVQSYTFSNAGWKPTLQLHIDMASGGGAYGNGTLRSFNQLYASSFYLGEGQFLSLSNLLMFAPGISVAPMSRVKLAMEYGYARRLKENDAAYAGGMRAYEGTERIDGHGIGSMFRVNATWTVMDHVSWFLNYEYFAPGEVLRRARLPSGSYANTGVSYRH